MVLEGIQLIWTQKSGHGFFLAVSFCATIQKSLYPLRKKDVGILDEIRGIKHLKEKGRIISCLFFMLDRQGRVLIYAWCEKNFNDGSEAARDYKRTAEG